MCYRSMSHLLQGYGPYTTELGTIGYRAVEPCTTGSWNMYYRAVEHELPSRGPFATGSWSIFYMAVEHILPDLHRLVNGCWPCAIIGRSPFFNKPWTISTGPWTICYRAVEHVLLWVWKFVTGAWSICYSDVDIYLTLHHFARATGPWAI